MSQNVYKYLRGYLPSSSLAYEYAFCIDDRKIDETQAGVIGVEVADVHAANVNPLIRFQRVSQFYGASESRRFPVLPQPRRSVTDCLQTQTETAMTEYRLMACVDAHGGLNRSEQFCSGNLRPCK